jgi:hypothetical protein
MNSRAPRQPDFSGHPGAALAPITARLSGWAVHVGALVFAAALLGTVMLGAWILLEALLLPFSGA